jgi:hypothetical protein
MSNIKIFDYEGSPIQFEVINGKVMANATLMAQAHKKSFKDWYKTDKAKSYIEARRKKLLLTENQMVVVRNGGNDNGSWIHESLILRFAQWLSTEFEIWCDEKIAELLRTGKVELAPMSLEEMMIHQLQAIVVERKRIDQIESKVDKLIKIHEGSVNEIHFVERSTEKMPEISVREKIKKIVWAYSNAKLVSMQDAYNVIYDRLYHRYHIAIRRYKRKPKETYLDVAEKHNFLDKMFIIASNELVI